MFFKTLQVCAWRSRIYTVWTQAEYTSHSTDVMDWAFSAAVRMPACRSRAPLGLFPALTPRSGFLLIPRPEAAGVRVVGSLPSAWETWAIFLWFLPWTRVAVRETLGGRLWNQHIGACFQSQSLKEITKIEKKKENILGYAYLILLIKQNVVI